MKRNFREKTCKICGNSFKPTYAAEKCCSDECKLKNYERTQATNQERQAWKAKKAKKPKPTDWSEIVRKCDEAGLTYGQAAARGII